MIYPTRILTLTLRTSSLILPILLTIPLQHHLVNYRHFPLHLELLLLILHLIFCLQFLLLLQLFLPLFYELPQDSNLLLVVFLEVESALLTCADQGVVVVQSLFRNVDLLRCLLECYLLLLAF